MSNEITRLHKENDSLRAALATSKDPCVYCQLPADEMAKCRSGFPGCARADDLSLCPEFGASMELHHAREYIQDVVAYLLRVGHRPVEDNDSWRIANGTLPWPFPDRPSGLLGRGLELLGVPLPEDT